jgi:Cys-rich repeat protein
MKKLSLVALVAAIAMLTGVAMANVPAPPVNQILGFDDTEFNALTEADCRFCHDSGIPDRHHMLYGSALTAGVCSNANGTCSTAGTPCVQDSDCPAGETCDAGTPGACLKNEDCAQPIDFCFITGDPCPGTCSISGDPCGEDAQCPAGETCVGGGDCPSSYTGQTCGQPICYGESAVWDPDADGDGSLDTAYGCLNCHYEDNSGGVINFVVTRDCLLCHQAGLNQPNVHHKFGGTAQSGDCVACHGDVVDNPGGCKELCCAPSFGPTAGTCTSTCTTDADCGGGQLCVALGPEAPCDDGHDIPTYTPSLVTPEPSIHTHACEFSMEPCESNQECVSGTCSVAATECWDDGDCPAGEICNGGERCDESIELSPAGACTFCHEPGIDTVSGVEVVDNHDTHHHTGVYKTPTGGSQRDKCAWCHEAGNPHNTGGHELTRIRFCENCHGYESLHNIQVDTNGGGVVPGGEDYGFGHIGRDNPLDPENDSDCWGCHAISAAAEGVVLGSGVPSLTSVDPIIIAAGTPTQLAITGATFLNGDLAVTLTAADGSVITLAAADVTDGSLSATANAAAGTYALQVVKDGEASNAIAVTVVPDVAIADVMCSKCLGTMTITGVNFAEKPAGTDEDISVTEDGRPLNVISWSDTEITVSGARCRGDVVVNGVYGSSQ